MKTAKPAAISQMKQVSELVKFYEEFATSVPLELVGIKHLLKSKEILDTISDREAKRRANEFLKSKGILDITKVGVKVLQKKRTEKRKQERAVKKAHLVVE